MAQGYSGQVRYHHPRLVDVDPDLLEIGTASHRADALTLQASMFLLRIIAIAGV